MGLQGFLCAIQAGGCAALATVCAKLVSTPVFAINLLEGFCLFINRTVGMTLPVLATNELTVVIQVLAVAGIILFNALMWVLFTKSMHLCSSTLEATASTTSSNFIFTAVFGKVVFKEQLGLLWWLGSSLVVLGLAVLHGSSSQEPKQNISHHEQQQTKKTS